MTDTDLFFKRLEQELKKLLGSKYYIVNCGMGIIYNNRLYITDIRKDLRDKFRKYILKKQWYQVANMEDHKCWILTLENNILFINFNELWRDTSGNKKFLELANPDFSVEKVVKIILNRE